MKHLDPRVGVAIAVIAIGLLTGALVYSLADRPTADTRTGSETTPGASVDETPADALLSADASAAVTGGVSGSGAAGAAAAALADAHGTANGTGGGTTPQRPPGSSPSGGDDGWEGGSVSDPKATLSIEQRKECYYRLIEAEYRAIAEAEAAYPQEVEEADLDAHYEMRFRLTDQYQAEIGKEYDLTFDGVVAVLVEGAEGNWPLPPMTE